MEINKFDWYANGSVGEGITYECDVEDSEYELNHIFYEGTSDGNCAWAYVDKDDEVFLVRYYTAEEDDDKAYDELEGKIFDICKKYGIDVSSMTSDYR